MKEEIKMGDFAIYDNGGIYKISGNPKCPTLHKYDRNGKLIYLVVTEYSLSVAEMNKHQHWKKYNFKPQIVNDYAIF